jgi:hypothetical protein
MPPPRPLQSSRDQDNRLYATNTGRSGLFTNIESVTVCRPAYSTPSRPSTGACERKRGTLARFGLHTPCLKRSLGERFVKGPIGS